MLTGYGIIGPVVFTRSDLRSIGLAVVVIFLLLSANYQSPRLALVTVSTAPAVVAGLI